MVVKFADVELVVVKGASEEDEKVHGRAGLARWRWVTSRPKSLAALLVASIAVLVLEVTRPAVCAGPPHIPAHLCLDGDSYLATWITVVVLLALCNDAPPELVLLYSTVVLVVAPGPESNKRLITSEQAWEGYATQEAEGRPSLSQNCTR